MTGQGFSRRDFVKGAVLGSVVAAMFVPAVSEARADGDPARGEQRY